MNEPLRPLNLGEILDRTLELYRARFLVFFGIAALPSGIVLAIASASLLFFLWFGSGASALAAPLLAGVLALVFFAVLLLVGFPVLVGAAALGTAALSHAAAHAYRDQDISIRAACRLAWKRGWRYLWLYVLQSLLVFVAPMMAWNLALLLATMAGAVGVGAGGLLAGIVAIASAWSPGFCWRWCGSGWPFPSVWSSRPAHGKPSSAVIASARAPADGSLSSGCWERF